MSVLHKRFRLVNFLDIEISMYKKGIFLFHRKYILDLLLEIGKLGAKPCNALMTPNLQLISEYNEPFDDLKMYSRSIEKLNYLIVTYLDITYSISIVSQFMFFPTVAY